MKKIMPSPKFSGNNKKSRNGGIINIYRNENKINSLITEVLHFIGGEGENELIVDLRK